VHLNKVSHGEQQIIRWCHGGWRFGLGGSGNERVCVKNSGKRHEVVLTGTYYRSS
jgi:hypothetical protein